MPAHQEVLKYQQKTGKGLIVGEVDGGDVLSHG